MKRKNRRRIWLKRPVEKTERSNDYLDEERKATNFLDQAHEQKERKIFLFLILSVGRVACRAISVTIVRVHSAK